MKTISSTGDLLDLNGDLTTFILDSCPWMAEPWEPENLGYVFVLDDRDIKEFDFAQIAHANESQLYETEDYAFSVTTSQLPNLGWYIWIIIEKETGKLFFYEGNKHTQMFNSPYYGYIGNKI